MTAAVRSQPIPIRKYTLRLEERGLITTESTEVITRGWQRRNGNLLYTMHPIGEVMSQFYQGQFERLDLLALRSRAAARLEQPSGSGKKSRL